MKRYFPFLLILLSLIIWRCSLDLPQDPRPPKWILQIEEIPLFKADTLRIGDNLKADDFNRLGPDSILSVNENGQKTIGLSDKLRIDARSFNVTAQLGTFEINATQEVNSAIYFTDIYPELAGYLGTQVIIPPKDIEPTKKAVTLTNFDSVSVVTGRVRFDVSNYLGFDLAGGVRMAIVDAGRGMVPIDTLELDQLKKNETRFFYLDLANKHISSNIIILLFGHSDGSGDQTVTIPTDSRLETIVTPENIVADEAYGAKLSEQILEINQSVDLSTDSLTVRSGEIEYGAILLEITNRFDFGIGLDIEVLNITDVNGNPFNLSLNLNPGQRASDNVYLDNGFIDLDGNDLNFRTKMRIFPDSDGKYNLKATDELGVAASITNIQFSSLTADFNLTTSFPEIGVEVFKDGDNNVTNFDFKDVWLRLTFLDTPFNLGLNLTFNAVRRDTSYKIFVQNNISANGELLLNQYGVNNDNSQPTIVDLFNIIPESLFVSGAVRVMGQNVTFHKEDNLGVRYDIDFPLSFSLTNAHYSMQDSLTIKQSTRQNIIDYARGGSVSVSLVNGLPISGFLTMYIGVDSSDVNEEFFTIVLPRPSLRSDGVVAQPGSGNFTVDIDQQKFIDLANSYFYRFEVRADDATKATLTANDYLIIKDVFISGKFLVDPDSL